MTNEEREDAIRFFEWVIEDKPMKYSELALEALKAQELKNSSDCISRQGVIDFCESLMNAEVAQETDDWGYGRERYNQTEAIQHHVEIMPSVQPERKTGQWIEYIPEHGKCPFCGNLVDLMNGKENNYCGECGADMRGKP